MFLVITGNVDPNEVITIVKENQQKRTVTKQDKIVLKEYHEPDHLAKKDDVVEMEVEIPKVALMYKINIQHIEGIAKRRIVNYLLIYFDLKLGSTSNFSEKLKHDGMITSNLYFNFVDTEEHLLFMIIGETKYPDQLISLIQEELKDQTMKEVDLKRKIKANVSNFIFMSDNIYSMNHKVMNNLIRYHEVKCDDIEETRSLNIEEFQHLMQQINFNNYGTFQIIPKK